MLGSHYCVGVCWGAPERNRLRSFTMIRFTLVGCIVLWRVLSCRDRSTPDRAREVVGDLSRHTNVNLSFSTRYCEGTQFMQLLFSVTILFFVL